MKILDKNVLKMSIPNHERLTARQAVRRCVKGGRMGDWVIAWLERARSSLRTAEIWHGSQCLHPGPSDWLAARGVGAVNYEA